MATPTKVNKRSISNTSISPELREGKKTKLTMEDAISKINKNIATFTADMAKLKGIEDMPDKVATLTKTVTDIQEKITSSLDSRSDYSESYQDLKLENKFLKTQIDLMWEKITDLEYYQKRNNLVFEGIPECKGETNYECFTNIIDLLSPITNTADMKIARCQ